MTESLKRETVEDFDLDGTEFQADFEGVSANLLAKCPVAHSPALGGYKVAFTDAEIRNVAQNWQLFSSKFGFEPNRASEDTDRLYPQELDPPHQSRWRSTIGPYLSPRVVEEREESVRLHVNDLIDSFIEDGEVEFIDAFAKRLPARIFFGSFLKVPLEDIPYILSGIEDSVAPRHPGDTDETYTARRAGGWSRVATYLNDYMRMREEEPPRGDFVDAILAGVETDDGTRSPWSHKVAVMTDLLSGGLGTTTFLLGGVAHFLATDDPQRQLLSADPGLHRTAVEELARYYASVLALGRTATEDTELAGVSIKKGEMLMLAYAVGCRDPKIFENPNEIDVTRVVKGNLAFGFGPHRCPGNHIAKLQARVAMQELIRRIPDLRLKSGTEPVITHATVVRNWDTLPMVFTPGARENRGIEPQGDEA